MLLVQLKSRGQKRSTPDFRFSIWVKKGQTPREGQHMKWFKKKNATNKIPTLAMDLHFLCVWRGWHPSGTRGPSRVSPCLWRWIRGGLMDSKRKEGGPLLASTDRHTPCHRTNTSTDDFCRPFRAAFCGRLLVSPRLAAWGPGLLEDSHEEKICPFFYFEKYQA